MRTEKSPLLLDTRRAGHNRNKKIAAPGKPSRVKCPNGKVNQRHKAGNNSSSSNDNLMIDDCREVEANNEASVGFVQEWINTYAFLSRELLCHFLLFPVISFPFSSLESAFQFPLRPRRNFSILLRVHLATGYFPS
jgi:hypothetical protein